MACLILTSCTEGNTTKLVTLPAASLSLIPFIGQHVSIIGYPGICFSVEQTENPCIDCEKADSIIPTAGNPVCNCTIPFTSYILTPCDPSLPTLYTTQNLYEFVGTSITFFGQAGACYNVIGSLTIPSLATPVIVDCAEACQCEIVVCGCPPGYTLNDDGLCEGILSVPPINNGTQYVVAQALWFEGTFGTLAAEFYEDITNKPWPILSTAPGNVSAYSDNSLVPLLITNTLSNQIWGGLMSSLNFRMRVAGVWTNSFTYDPIDEWIGFSYCVELTETKTYYIAYAVDDFARILIDGALMLNQDTSGWAFEKLQIFPITLTAGIHTITGEVKNAGVSAIFAFEIYDATLAQLLAVANPGDIDPYIAFSSGDQIGLNWQTGENSGYSCPDGYALNTCDGLTCTQIVTVPQVPCFAWQITFCEGTGLDPIITSTDLTAYIGSVYEITYTSSDPQPIVITACGSVTRIDAQVADAFIGTFSEITYDCCEACQAVCYLLEDCQEAVPSMLLCTDLKDYIGKIIKIAGCGNICWTVSQVKSCIGSIKFEGEVTEFDTCEECLPPIPVPVPLELNLRKVKPGYNSPNSCVTLEYLQRVNCNFALQVYNEMLIKRYGITVCCDQDVDAWDIQKSELDYMLMGDPSLCKSTLCDCKPPCLIDVVFALAPTCVDPIIYDASIAINCAAPVLTDVEIALDIPCNCYILTGSNYTLNWRDCCCVDQSNTFVSNATVCSQTLPVVTEGAATVVLADVCGGELCVAVPPVCYCWTVTPDKIGITTLTYNNCTGIPVVINNIPYATTIEVCSPSSPIITGEGVVASSGFCNLDCGIVVNAACSCYVITVTSTDASVANVEIGTRICVNGSGIEITSLTSADGPLYICSSAAPRVISGSANAQVTMTINNSLDCNAGECVAP